MPRTIRVGAKSGVLPEPRQVVPRLKTALELAQDAKVRTGYADPAMAPRKAGDAKPSRSAKSVAEKVKHSARAPNAAAVGTAKLSESRVWRQHIADVRRAYFAGSLEAYQAQEQQHRAQREKRQAAGAAEAAAPTQLEESRATQFTMPTIESALLRGLTVEPRTAEEQEELAMKRAHNRKQTERELLERQAEQLLALYQQASQFIVTSEQLEAAVAREFRSDESVPSLGANDAQMPAWFKYLRAFRLESETTAATQRSREAELAEAVKGTVLVREAGRTGKAERELPGLKEVRDALE